MSSERNSRRTEEGLVSSDGRDKTIAVEVTKRVKFPKYGKFVKRTTRYHAHDEKNEARAGDTVQIAETRPLSRLKRWRLLRIIKRAQAAGGSEN